jgi:hypothetical protein
MSKLPHPISYSSFIFQILFLNIQIKKSLQILTKKWLLIDGTFLFALRFETNLSSLLLCKMVEQFMVMIVKSV